MPKLGYGVYQVTLEECERCVLEAISVGYRSIDTAQAYGNEEGVGNAIEKCGVPREELFITTKVWISNGGYEKAKTSSISRSMIITEPIVRWRKLTRRANQRRLRFASCFRAM